MYHPSSQPKFTESTVSSNIRYSNNLLMRSCMKKILGRNIYCKCTKKILSLREIVSCYKNIFEILHAAVNKTKTIDQIRCEQICCGI
jgi:hypothetical protein